MNYKYKTMEEVALTYPEDDLMYALDLMDMDFEETETREVLAKRLVQAQKNHLNEIFHMASYEDLQALEIMSQNQGHFIDGDVLTMHKGLFPDDLLNLPEDLCLLANDENRYNMESESYVSYESYCSEEFLNLFKEYFTQEKKALAFALDEMARIIKGCLYYYGAIEIEDLYKIVSSQYKELNRNLFKTVLGYKHSLYYAYETEMLDDKEYIKDEFFDVFHSLEEVEEWKSVVGEYKSFEREELFDAGDDLFVEDLEAHTKVVKYFEPYFEAPEDEDEDDDIFDIFGEDDDIYDEDEVEDEDEEIDFELEDGVLFGFVMINTVELLQRTLDQSEIIGNFLEYFNFENIEMANNGLTLLMNYVNNLSRWDNRGYSPVELREKYTKNNNVIPMKAYRKK